MLKRVLAFLLAATTLFMFAGCKDFGPLIENEDQAKEIIECPNDNMFGLEKIVVFEDRIVTVFDKKICDDFEYDEKNAGSDRNFTLERYLNEEKPGFRIDVSNLTYSGEESFSSSIEIKKGKYVVTAAYDNSEIYKSDPNKDFEIDGVYIGGFDISIYEDEIELDYVARGYDIMWYYKQVFDRSKGTWDNVDEEEIGCETQPEKGWWD